MVNDPTRYGSHLPLLLRLLSITDSDVLELGTGFFSTPIINAACELNKRRADSYDSNEKYYNIAKWYEGECHKVHFVEDWDNIPIEKKWDVAMIDHLDPRRGGDALRIANYATFIVLHDTCPKNMHKFGYDTAIPKFKYHYRLSHKRPNTSVVSNFVDLSTVNLW